MFEAIKKSSNYKTIKVCHIIAKMVYGGASIGTLHLAEKLDPKIFDCTIIHGFQSENEGRLFHKNTRKTVKYISLSEMVREINLIKDFQTFLKLVRIIKKHRYDIVHTHGSKAGVIGRIAAAVARVPAILYTVHGWGLKAGNFFTRTIFRFIEKVVASFTTVLLFQTTSDMEEAGKYNIGTRNQYYLIGNGVYLTPFLFYNKQKSKKIRSALISPKKHVVGTIGRVSAQKNPRGFIEIVQKVLEKQSDILFLFVGGGELLREMQQTLNDLGLSSNIIFTGVRTDVPELLANFDVFILPSLWEGMPRSVIEAMAMAKPVIVYDIRGIDEIIVDGENGFIVSVNDTSAFADRILYLLNNPVKTKVMGYNGFLKAKEFDYENVIERVGQIYIDMYKYCV